MFTTIRRVADCATGDIQKAISTLTVLSLLGVTPSVHADINVPWTTAASAGTVDESSAANVMYTGSFAQISPVAPVPASVTIRYNVTHVDGLSYVGTGYRLTIRFTDSGTSTRVTARLVEQSLITNTSVNRIYFDSNSYPAAISTQLRSVHACPASWTFQFGTKVYFVEVVLTKSAAGASPVLVGVSIARDLC